jgi:hypothetical protein
MNAMIIVKAAQHTDTPAQKAAISEQTNPRTERSSEPLPAVTPDAEARSSPASVAPAVRGR